MTKAEAHKLWGLICAAWPRGVPEHTAEDTGQIYIAMLSEVEIVAAMRAVHDLIRESKWLPAVSEIRDRVRANAFADWERRDLVGYARSLELAAPSDEIDPDAGRLIENLARTLAGKVGP